MKSHTVDAIDILLWTNPHGLSAFAAPWAFDLEYDSQGNGTIDASAQPLNIANYPASIDRYRILHGPARAQILKLALQHRSDYQALSNDFHHYLVRQDQAGIDEKEFLRIVAAFIHVWRKRQ